MNHRFFEERLFTDEPLTAQERLFLEQHLRSCERCRTLHAAWQETQLVLESAGWVAPRAGFSQRWQKRYVQREARTQQRRALALFVINALLAALFAFPVFALVVFSPQPLWLRVVIALYNLSALVPILEGIYTFLFTIIRATSQLLTPATEAALIAMFVGLTLIWLAMLRKFSARRVTC
ncbi:MAG: zf-HC2 domain-containing protein [Anaerolineales bacterium]|nr:zf-HC2 domain-containing protein [Anaerolineales bacterium]MCS7246627.1 zf-HC2 domain-containing protein [Anaerolineales bacterium]MDW8160437.1 zf-HC2 domain-containing protein [Anaerolineales bacterium]MDW8447780.1 zf-HC2 domain-containing protein [Anaerolineales bacterium]